MISTGREFFFWAKNNFEHFITIILFYLIKNPFHIHIQSSSYEINVKHPSFMPTLEIGVVSLSLLNGQRA